MSAVEDGRDPSNARDADLQELILNDPTVRASVEQRLWPRVEKTPTCWLYADITSDPGYGRLVVKGTRAMAAHRIAYVLLVGPIAPGLVLDHLCRQRRCVNPSHLDPCAMRENTLRGVGIVAINAAKDKCEHGHPFDEKNTKVRADGGRACRACIRRRRIEYRRKSAGLRTALESVTALEQRWTEALESGCPSCGDFAGDNCDHIEGYHHALHDLRAVLAVPAIATALGKQP